MKLPDLKCESCGHCESNFHKTEKESFGVGFCHRFKEMTSLSEVNPRCWTGQEQNHYATLAYTVDRSRIALDFRNKRKAKDKGLNFDNQLTIF